MLNIELNVKVSDTTKLNSSNAVKLKKSNYYTICPTNMDYYTV